MRRYVLFGLIIESEIELADVDVVVNGSPDVTIRLGEILNPCRKAGLLEEYVNIASLVQFHIRNGNEIIVQFSTSLEPGLLRVLISGRIMAYLLRQRGWMPLHASAIDIGGLAVLFLAPVGTGKSTTAAAFHRRGYQVLSDDVSPVRVEGGKCFLACGQPTLRLCEDAADTFRCMDPAAKVLYDKEVFHLNRKATAALIEISTIYFLADGETFNIATVPVMKAMAELGRECFIKLQRAGDEVLRTHLQTCATIVGHTRICQIVRPRGLHLLDKLVDVVISDLHEFNAG